MIHLDTRKPIVSIVMSCVLLIALTAAAFLAWEAVPTTAVAAGCQPGGGAMCREKGSTNVWWADKSEKVTNCKDPKTPAWHIWKADWKVTYNTNNQNWKALSDPAKMRYYSADWSNARAEGVFMADAKTPGIVLCFSAQLSANDVKGTYVWFK